MTIIYFRGYVVPSVIPPQRVRCCTAASQTALLLSRCFAPAHYTSGFGGHYRDISDRQG